MNKSWLSFSLSPKPVTHPQPEVAHDPSLVAASENWLRAKKDFLINCPILPPAPPYLVPSSLVYLPLQNKFPFGLPFDTLADLMVGEFSYYCIKPLPLLQ